MLDLSRHNKSNREKRPREWAVTARKSQKEPWQSTEGWNQGDATAGGENPESSARALGCVRSIVPKGWASPAPQIARQGVGVGSRAEGYGGASLDSSEPWWLMLCV